MIPTMKMIELQSIDAISLLILYTLGAVHGLLATHNACNCSIHYYIHILDANESTYKAHEKNISINLAFQAHLSKPHEED